MTKVTTLDLKALDTDLFIRGDDVVPRTITIGQQFTNSDLLIVDTENMQLASNGDATFGDGIGGNVLVKASISSPTRSTGANNEAFGAGALSSITTGTQNNAVGKDALSNATTGGLNMGYGNNAGSGIVTGVSNTAVGPNTLARGDVSNCTAIGTAACREITAGPNLGIGFNSCKGDNTVGGSGVNNLAIGNNALTTFTTGSTNVAIGDNALTALSTANQNVAIGKDSLKSLTTGGNNVAIGINAGGAITTATNTTAIGPQALTRANLSFCTAIGDSACREITAGPNLGIGFNAGKGDNTAGGSGTNNISIGNAVMQVYTTGQNNVGVGNDALTDLTTGSANVAIGRLALTNVTTGTANVAIGFSAGDQLTTVSNTIAIGNNAVGRANVADCLGIGASACREITAGPNMGIGLNACKGDDTSGGSGVNNVAIGNSALIAFTTGASNTVVGHQAGQFLTTGTDNVAVGKDAGRSLTTGLFNTFVGSLSGDVVTTAFNNVGVGTNALGLNVSGSSNVAVGSSALANTTAGTNTAIGHFAGNGITTGAGNVFVGHNAGRNETTISNRLIINNASTDPPLIFGEFDNAKVGIKEKTPEERFHVSVEDTAAVECLALEQNDLSEGFVNFKSTAAASAANPISSLTTPGVPSGFVRVEENGTDRWLQMFANPSTPEITLGAAATTFAVNGSYMQITGDAGANTVATITGGVKGMLLTLKFMDALVTITDTAAATVDTVNLSAAFTSAANTTLQLVHDGNKWFETSRSVN